MNEEEIQQHLESHADMFTPTEEDYSHLECFTCKKVFPANEIVDGYNCAPCKEELYATPKDTDTQTLTYLEIKEMLQAVFEQGILRGITEGQNTVLDMINNDPEIESDTAKYITHIVLGGDN